MSAVRALLERVFGVRPATGGRGRQADAPGERWPASIEDIGLHLPSGAFVTDRDSSMAALKAAERALEGGEPEKACGAAFRSMMAEPGWHRSHRTLGRALDRCGREDSALSAYGNALDETTMRERLGGQRFECPETVAGDQVAKRHPVYGVERCPVPEAGTIDLRTSTDFPAREIVTRPAFVDVLTDGRIWQDGLTKLVLDDGGRRLLPHCYGNQLLASHLASRHEPVRVEGRLVDLGAPGTGNFYHWLADILPKLHLVEKSGVAGTPDDRYLVPFLRSRFQHETLTRLGVRPEQVIFANLLTPWFQAEEIVVPHLDNAMGNAMGRWVPTWLQSALSEDRRPSSSASPSRGGRLFVRRDVKTSQGRGVENEADVARLLDRYGFESIYPERMSVVEQAAVFARADSIVSPHGAGLTNIVHCRPGTRVFEFYGDHLAPCYRSISALLGLRYFCHRCTPSRGDPSDARSLPERRSSGFPIPLPALSSLLDAGGVRPPGSAKTSSGSRS